MRMWIEVEGNWSTRDEANDRLSNGLRGTGANRFVIEEAEQHERDEAQGYIEFRVYLQDDATPEQIDEVADHLQDVLIDETALEHGVTEDVSYAIVPKKVTN